MPNFLVTRSNLFLSKQLQPQVFWLYGPAGTFFGPFEFIIGRVGLQGGQEPLTAVSKSVSGYFSFLDRVKKLLVCSTSDLVWMDFKGSFPNSHMGIGKFSIILDFLEMNI